MKYVKMTGAEPVGVMSRRDAGVAWYRKFGKRAFDVSLALLLLPLVAPVLFVLWALTRLDGGPGFYVQERVGKDGKLFGCLKIRSMVVDADERLSALCASDPEIAREWHVNQKLDNDPRITAIGRFVRATSLDELPQLLNILKGDMSFVGPRPFTGDQEALYRNGGGSAYFQLRPGITGPWQVFGRSQTTFLDRVRYDEAYFGSLSLWRDLVLIVRTAGVVFASTGK